MILHEARGKTEPGKPKPTKLYSESGMAKGQCDGRGSAFQLRREQTE
jgi:hypothetical protein